MANQKFWATTLAWGRNAEGDETTHAVLAESSVTRAERDVWFGRLEVGAKAAHDLHAEEFGDEIFTVSKVQGGYTRYLATASGLHFGVGGYLSAGFVPDTLKPRYGSRGNLGVGFFLTIRPVAMRHDTHATAQPVDHSQHQSAPPATPPPTGAARPAVPNEPARTEPRLPVVEAERVIDPACSAKIDVTTAPRATYQGKVYYFCSAADRDTFLKDPAAYLQKRGQR
jgi:YHS domain-containing protein